MKPRDKDVLSAFFEPGSVAVFGSLKDMAGLGYGAIKNMLSFGFKGSIYPVNPGYEEVLGLKAYPSLSEVAAPVELAVVITPPATVPEIIEQCALKGVKAAVVVSENFAEANEQGAQLQQHLVDIARRSSIRIIGPNTVGTLNTANGLLTIPYMIGYENIHRGGIAYCSQSGLAAAQCQPLEERAYPISKMCDFGNKCDVNEADMLNYLRDDPETKVIAMHLEDVKDGRRFMEAARRASACKPLLLYKTGRSEAGARASASHTGSLMGDDRVYDSAFKQAGAIRVDTWQEFWDIPKVFAYREPPRGNRIAIISHSGGAGVAAADAAVEAGLDVTELSPETIEKLISLLPRNSGNPVDMGPVLAASADPLSTQEEILAAVLADARVDCATIILYAGVMAPMQPLADMFERLMQHVSKPVTIWVYGTKLFLVEETSRQLEARGLPTYIDIETAVKALGVAAGYAGRVKP